MLRWIVVVPEPFLRPRGLFLNDADMGKFTSPCRIGDGSCGGKLLIPQHHSGFGAAASQGGVARGLLLKLGAAER